MKPTRYPTGELTIAFQSYGAGDKAALDRITPVLYQELRKLAASRPRVERADHTLQATGQ